MTTCSVPISRFRQDSVGVSENIQTHIFVKLPRRVLPRLDRGPMSGMSEHFDSPKNLKNESKSPLEGY